MEYRMVRLQASSKHFPVASIIEPENVSMMLATGPFDIPSGSSVTAAFAILGFYRLEDLQAIADAARAKYAIISDIDGATEKRLSFSIEGNYPNPFNFTAGIHYNLPEPTVVKIDIYDIMGRRVETLVNGRQPAGYHQIKWDATEFSSGIYFYRVQAGGLTATKKMTLLK
jgi:hypothetical protein